MPDRITNLGLGVLVVLAVLTGFVAFSIGSPVGRWVVVFHGITGLAVVVVSPWKAVIARRGLTRSRPGRWISVSLTSSTLVTLATGVILTIGLVDRVGPLTMMQLHVGGGLLTLLVTLIHFRQRPTRLRRTDLSRRAALRATGTLGLAGIMYLGAEATLTATGVPGRNRRFTGSHEVDTPLPTSWLDDKTPFVDGTAHLVTFPAGTLTVAELDEFSDMTTATLDCTGGWHSTNAWSGVRLDRLLGDLEGESVVVRSVTGYWRRFPLDQANRLWLATRIDKAPLQPGNGAPVRLVAPGRRGFWWVKWVDEVEVDTLPSWWQPPLPLA